jgi:hypothetical protein
MACGAVVGVTGLGGGLGGGVYASITYVNSTYNTTASGTYTNASRWNNSPAISAYPNNNSSYDFYVTINGAGVGTTQIALTQNITLSSLSLSNAALAGGVAPGSGGTAPSVTDLGNFNNGTGNFRLLSGAALELGGASTIGTGTIDGDSNASLNILAGGTFTSDGTGQTTIAIPFNNDGALAVAAGTLSVKDAGSGTGTATISSGATLQVNSASYSQGAVVNNGNLNIVSGGNATFTTVDGAGTLSATLSAVSATHVRQTLLNIDSAGAVTIADSPGNPGNTAATSVVTDINDAGTLDLKNNDLIVLDTTQYSTVKNLIVDADDGGAWDKPGITSSSARANSGSYGLGYAQASTIGSVSFDGQSFSDAVLVKYTLLGDTQLRGTVGIGDYDAVLSNFGQPQDWSGGDFHYGGVVGIGDYDDVLSNYGAHASGNLTPGPSLASSAMIKPNLAKTDLKLEVNTTTGDVYVLATASAAFTGYTISDPSAHLLGGSTSPDPDKLLSVSAGNGGNTNVYETSGTYVDWFKITETASQVAEGQQQNGFGTHSSRDDTINIPAGGTIDFGDIYNTAAAQQDLTFDFAEAGTEPTNGPTYYGAEVDYITSSTPEPGGASLLVVGAIGVLARRRRRWDKSEQIEALFWVCGGGEFLYRSLL